MNDRIDLREQPVRLNGITYKSQSEFARAMGVTPTTVSQALKRGTLANVGKGAQGAIKPVSVDGVDYASTSEAMAGLGVTWKALQKRIDAQMAVSPKSGSRYLEGARA